jgi:hypothetical protein
MGYRVGFFSLGKVSRLVVSENMPNDTYQKVLISE